LCKNMPPLELAIQFHGHICPGLITGVRAAEFARQYLQVDADTDEQMVAVVETNSCAVDAIQAILGCTFGKGNLIFKDHGKSVFTIASREKKRAIRIANRYDSAPDPERERYRILCHQEELSEAEVWEKEELLGTIFEKIISAPIEELFTWREIDLELPERAKIYPTVQCSVCGEGVMESRAVRTASGYVCPTCI
jgi:formylmethanofuran dehydrogenase subunit E